MVLPSHGGTKVLCVYLHSNSGFRIRVVVCMKCVYAISTDFVKAIGLFSTFLAVC